jgi:allophanate hydrolase subunit 2
VTATRAPREHRVRVRYDGEDLIEVAERIGVTTDEVARVHAAAVWTVRFLGFLPGFAYLESEGWPWDLPRRPSPRRAVPAGALAVAGRRCGVYPDASPGGWNLLGTAEGWPGFVDGASALGPGDHVRFEPAARSAEQPSLGPRAAVDADGVWLEVVSVVGPAWLQDEGRPGRRHAGVPRGGALAPRGLARVRSAVPGAGLPAIEHVGPLRLRVHGGAAVVAFGGSAPEVVPLAEGDTVDVPAPAERVGHVVVAGGFDVPEALGGRGYLTAGAAIWADPSALPARPLRSGDRLRIREVQATVLPGAAAPDPPSWEGPTPYGLIPFVPLDADRTAGFCSARWTIAAASRVGLRLHGPALRPPAPLDGSGVTWPGAVQLPPDGQPIVLGPDHGVTGGYPIIGSVPVWGDLFARRDGAVVRFFAVDRARLVRR